MGIECISITRQQNTIQGFKANIDALTISSKIKSYMLLSPSDIEFISRSVVSDESLDKKREYAALIKLILNYNNDPEAQHLLMENVKNWGEAINNKDLQVSRDIAEALSHMIYQENAPPITIQFLEKGWNNYQRQQCILNAISHASTKQQYKLSNAIIDSFCNIVFHEPDAVKKSIYDSIILNLAKTHKYVNLYLFDKFCTLITETEYKLNVNHFSYLEKSIGSHGKDNINHTRLNTAFNELYSTLSIEQKGTLVFKIYCLTERGFVPNAKLINSLVSPIISQNGIGGIIHNAYKGGEFPILAMRKLEDLLITDGKIDNKIVKLFLEINVDYELSDKTKEILASSLHLENLNFSYLKLLSSHNNTLSPKVILELDKCLSNYSFNQEQHCNFGLYIINIMLSKGVITETLAKKLIESAAYELLYMPTIIDRSVVDGGTLTGGNNLFLSCLDILLVNSSAEIALDTLEKLLVIQPSILNKTLKENLTLLTSSPVMPAQIKNGLYKILAIKHCAIDSAATALNNLTKGELRSMSESISYLVTVILEGKYRLSGPTEAKIVEEALAKINPENKADIKGICYILSMATHVQKHLLQLKPDTIKTLCTILIDPSTKPLLKQHICKSLEYLLRMNPTRVLKNNEGIVVDSLASTIMSIKDNDNSMTACFGGCFTTIADNIKKIDDTKLDHFIDTITSKITTFHALPTLFNGAIQSLNQALSHKHLSLESISNLIEYSATSSALDDVQKAQILEIILSSFVTQEQQLMPLNLATLANNLISKDSTVLYLTLRILNLFEPSDDLLLQIVPGSIENIIIESTKNINQVEAAQEHAMQEAFDLIKSEACLLLASAMRKGYVWVNNTTSIGNILQNYLSLDTSGELLLFKICLEISNIDTRGEDEGVSPLVGMRSNNLQNSSIQISDKLINQITNVIRCSIKSNTIIAAIHTLISAISYSSSPLQSLEQSYILDSLNIGLKYGQETHSEEIIDCVTAAIDFLQKKFELNDRRDEENEVIEEVSPKLVPHSELSPQLDLTSPIIPRLQPSFVQTNEELEISDIGASPRLNFQKTEELDLREVIDPDIRSDEELLLELQKNNNNVDIDKLRTQLVLVNKAYETYTDYWIDDIKAWTQNKGREAPIEEIIGVIKRANFIHTNGHILRSTQILSALLLLEPQNKGRLAQISTGEGKSATIAILAILHAIRKQKVDIITSSALLAIRDAEFTASIFYMFNLTCWHNIDHKYRTGVKEGYEMDIVYGDATTFEHDFLRHEYKGANTRGDRLLEDSIAIVDEVDSMLLDESSKIAKIAGHTPGMEYLIPLLALIWRKAQDLDADPSIAKNTLEEAISSYTEQLLNKNYSGKDKLILPNHLMDFAEMQTRAWAASSVRALNSKLDVDYVITRDEKNGNVVAPVDHANTGIVQAKTAWVDGLHQFLQMKESLAITSENLTTAFISNLSFFKLYGSSIYGLTGTLGSHESQALLSEEYDVDTVCVPTYKPSLLKVQEGMVATNETEWMKHILTRTREELEQNRALLIICDTILAAKNIEAALKQIVTDDKIRAYYRSDDEAQSAGIESITSGEIIVATNLAGRGTDIHTYMLEEHGGLHVIVTFLPKNPRVETQAFGRTARQGQSGSAELILDASKEIQKFGGSFTGNKTPTIEEFRRARDILEREELARATTTKIPRLKVEDQLFRDFAIFKKELEQKDASEYLQQNLEEQWGLWLKKHTTEKNNDFDASGLKQKFEEFKQITAEKYHSPQNPIYLARKAYSIMSSGSYEGSFGPYREAIKLDSIYSFIAAYNMGYAVVRENNRNSRHYNDSAPAEVAGYLSSALENIRNVHLPQTKKIYEVLQPREDTPLMQQIQAKCEILEYQVAYIEPALSTSGGMSRKNHINIRGYQLLRDMFPSNDPIYKAAIAEVNSSGLHLFYDLGVTIQKKKDNGWNMIASIAASTLLAPVVGPWALGFSNVFIGGAAGALALGGASRMAGSIVDNRGRIDKAFQDVTSAKSLKSLGLEAVSAGICAGVLDKIDIADLSKAKGTAARNVRIAQQHAIRAGVNSTVTGEKFSTSIKREAIRAGTNMTYNTVAAGSEAMKIAPNSFMRTIIDGSTGGAISIAQGGKFELGFGAGVIGNVSSKFVTGASKHSYRPDFSALGTAIVVREFTQGDKQAMSMHADIASSSSQFGHIEQVRAKAADLARRAEKLDISQGGVAAGNAPDEASLQEHFDPNLSFAAQRAETLIKWANDYAEFAVQYPTIAASLMPAIRIATKAMIGGIAGGTVGPAGAAAGVTAGAISGVLSEIQGWFIDEIAGDQVEALVNACIEKASAVCKILDPTLTDKQAHALGAAAIIGGIAGVNSLNASKEALKAIGALKGSKQVKLNKNVFLSKGPGDGKLPHVDLPEIVH